MSTLLPIGESGNLPKTSLPERARDSRSHGPALTVSLQLEAR